MKGHVLITGGAGFIGSHLIRVVSAAGYSVSSVSRGLIHTKNFSVLDLTNSSQVDAFVARSKPIDAIISFLLLPIFLTLFAFIKSSF